LGPLHKPADGDLYWQRWLGELLLQTHRLPTVLGPETFSAPGAPWVPQEWLFSLAVAASLQHRLFFALCVAVSAVPLAIFCSIFARARAIASPEAIGIALLFTGMAFAESFGVRPQVLGWACFAAFLFFLERDDRWYYAALPATIAWANVHASVAIAPAVILARLAATAVDGGWRALRSSRDLVMLPAVAIAMLCTPLGIRLPQYAMALAHSPIRHFIKEWQPASLNDAAFVAGALPLTIAILMGGKAALFGRKAQVFVAVLLFCASLFAVRNIPLFAIAAAPLAAIGIDRRFARLSEIPARLPYLQPVAMGGVATVIALAAISVTRTQAQEAPRLPLAAIGALAADRSPHRLFCENFTWCSVALRYPQLRVFMDGRCDPYPLTVWEQYIEAIDGAPPSRRILREYAVDTVLANKNGAFESALLATPQWRVAYADRAYVLFRRE
jgi:hypothetical protein